MDGCTRALCREETLVAHDLREELQSVLSCREVTILVCGHFVSTKRVAKTMS